MLWTSGPCTITENWWNIYHEYAVPDPVVQSIVSLTSLLQVKMLNVLVSTLPYSQVLLLKKCECKSYSHFFSKNMSVYAIFNDQSFNDTLTNDIVSFEQLGTGNFTSLLCLPFTTCPNILCKYAITHSLSDISHNSRTTKEYRLGGMRFPS